MGTSGISGSMGSAGGSGCPSSVQALADQGSSSGKRAGSCDNRQDHYGVELGAPGCLPPFLWGDEASP